MTLDRLVSRRGVLGGIAATVALSALPAGKAVAALTDYGSGTLGDWTGASHTISTDTQIVPARTGGAWVFGDSIMVGDAYDLATKLNAMGLSMAVNAWSSRPTTPAVDALEEWVGEYGQPSRVVMATGSNDIFDPTVMAAQVDRVMALATEAQVWWVNVYVGRTSVDAATREADVRNTGWINSQLARALARHDRLTVLPWFEFLAANPAYRLTAYLRDGVHTTDPIGRNSRNTLIANALS